MKYPFRNGLGTETAWKRVGNVPLIRKRFRLRFQNASGAFLSILGFNLETFRIRQTAILYPYVFAYPSHVFVYPSVIIPGPQSEHNSNRRAQQSARQSERRRGAIGEEAHNNRSGNFRRIRVEAWRNRELGALEEWRSAGFEQTGGGFGGVFIHATHAPAEEADAAAEDPVVETVSKDTFEYYLKLIELRMPKNNHENAQNTHTYMKTMNKRFLWVHQQSKVKNMQMATKAAFFWYLMTPILVFDGDLSLSSLNRTGLSLKNSDPFLSVSADESIKLNYTEILMLNGIKNEEGIELLLN
ncbi:hypothetical protein E3N88_01156 [Mikania micrantha]|uniref:Uncharacterized protein n=1 Tax=Mikania micrantha TaxID=192012 RepID=A0A5N6Q1M9_9ASTR|nr:hypothetical protein E3N88_01072 [Mikania micrantha]KAD7478020.1 hypothetical protein E3N88_01156 [Mikania micrantha]